MPHLLEVCVYGIEEPRNEAQARRFGTRQEARCASHRQRCAWMFKEFVQVFAFFVDRKVRDFDGVTRIPVVPRCSGE